MVGVFFFPFFFFVCVCMCMLGAWDGADEEADTLVRRIVLIASSFFFGWWDT